MMGLTMLVTSARRIPKPQQDGVCATNGPYATDVPFSVPLPVEALLFIDVYRYAANTVAPEGTLAWIVPDVFRLPKPSDEKETLPLNV
jgi:hypothetical protein